MVGAGRPAAAGRQGQPPAAASPRQPPPAEARSAHPGGQLLRQLLVFNNISFIGRLPDHGATIRRLGDLHERWADTCLAEEEKNVAELDRFLVSGVDLPLRLGGLQCIAKALATERRASRWRAEHTSDALVKPIDMVLTKNARELSQNVAALNAVLSIAADLTERQVPTALTLQERITQLRQEAADCSPST